MASKQEPENTAVTGNANLKSSLASFTEMLKIRRSEPQESDEKPKVNTDDQCPNVVEAPDGGWGWMVLLGTMTVNFVIIGHGKSFGVYFKKLMEEFDASPSRVAWLLSLQISTFSFLSPVTSVLSQMIGPRKVALAGGLLAFFGLAASSFMPSLEYLYIFYGAVQGIAITCTFTPGITMISKYFHRRRGLANGLTMAGNALGGILMPLVANILISEYSLRGCFLIMASILLHACVGAMLWQPVEWHQKKTPVEKIPMLDCNLQEEVHSHGASCPQGEFQSDPMQKSPALSSMEGSVNKLESGLDMSVDSFAACKSISPENWKELKDANTYVSGPNLYSNGGGPSASNSKMIRGGSSPHLADTSKQNERTYGSAVSTESLPHMFKLIPRLTKHNSRTSSFIYLSSYSFGPTAGAVLTKEHFTAVDSSDSNTIPEELSEIKKQGKWELTSCFRKLPFDKSIFEKSRIYIMTVTLFFHALGYPGTQTFLPYRATTLGLSEAQAASMLSVLAFTDVIGRISFAWMSDFNFCQRKYLFMFGMFMSGLLAYSLPFYRSYAALLAGAAGYGFFCGAYIGLVVVLFADAYSPEKVALAYSVSTVSGGFMALGGPPLVGYVLESTGSYVFCQLILGSAQCAGAAIWLAEPWADKWEKRRREKKEQEKSPEEQQLV